MTTASLYAALYGGTTEHYQRLIDTDRLSGIRSDGTNNEGKNR